MLSLQQKDAFSDQCSKYEENDFFAKSTDG